MPKLRDFLAVDSRKLPAETHHERALRIRLEKANEYVTKLESRIRELEQEVCDVRAMRQMVIDAQTAQDMQALRLDHAYDLLNSARSEYCFLHGEAVEANDRYREAYWAGHANTIREFLLRLEKEKSQQKGETTGD